MSISRRTTLFGAVSMALAAALPAVPALAAAGSRRMDLYRADDRIGEKVLTVRRNGNVVDVTTRTRIDVRLLGVTVYAYSLDASERWSDGRLVTLDARSNDNGSAEFARATREGDALRVEGSKFSGLVPGNPATTSYWSPAFLERRTWISTQDGRPMNVSARRQGSVSYPSASGAVSAARWTVGGDLTGLELFFDGAGEWVGTTFPARGETARFVTADRGGALTPLWVNA